jgi:hypothetical protein
MTTYSLILKNILKLNNNFFSFNYKSDNMDGILKFIFLQLFNKEYSIKNKFQFYKESLNNFLIKNKKENEFIYYFYKIQKTYNILNRFIYNYKLKKSKIVVNVDFCSNQLTVEDEKVMCIYHNKSKYLFHITDLIKIIETALTNSSFFFANPKSIKNPYDNIPFNKSTLYNIYFFIYFNTNYKSEFFFKFFEVDFNLTTFKFNNEYLLRNYCIKNYVYKSPSNILLSEIKKLINIFNLYCIKIKIKNLINIDKDFPKDKLIKIMQPYLLLFIMSQYAYLETHQKEASYLLNKVLVNFNNFNPNFGRKKYKIITKQYNYKTKIIEKIIEFDEKHIKFMDNNCQKNKFLLDHLKYEENILFFNVTYNGDEPIENDDYHEEEDDDEEDNNEEDNNEEDDEEEEHHQEEEEHEEDEEESIYNSIPDEFENNQYFEQLEEATQGGEEGVDADIFNEENYEEDSIS